MKKLTMIEQRDLIRRKLINLKLEGRTDDALLKKYKTLNSRLAWRDHRAHDHELKLYESF